MSGESVQPSETPLSAFGDALFEHPACWRGGISPAGLPGFERSLSEAQRRAWRAALDTSGPLAPELEALALELGRALEQGPGAVRLRGAPVEDLDDDACGRLFERLMRRVGHPVSQTADGRRLFPVRDAGFGQTDARARGPNSRRGLSFHTDRCDVIAFLTVRPAQTGGISRLVSSLHLLRCLRDEHPEALRELTRPFFWKTHNVDTGNARPWFRQPVAAVVEGRPVFNLLRVLIDRAHALDEVPDLTDSQRAALDLVESLAREPGSQIAFRMEPGDVLLVNNLVCLHSRDAFEDADDRAESRLLWRLWLATPESRRLPESYRGGYGAVEPGVIRGGMWPAGERERGPVIIPGRAEQAPVAGGPGDQESSEG